MGHSLAKLAAGENAEVLEERVPCAMDVEDEPMDTKPGQPPPSSSRSVDFLGKVPAEDRDNIVRLRSELTTAKDLYNGVSLSQNSLDVRAIIAEWPNDERIAYWKARTSYWKFRACTVPLRVAF